MTGYSVQELKEIAARHRKKLLDITFHTGGAYLAQALSGIDMMTALWYRYVRNRAVDPLWDGRDRFLLSPGHYALPLYVILADQGYFSEELLYTFKENGSPLELASHRGTVPGVEVTGGSLAQVLSVGVGMALHGRLRGKGHRIFVFMSDGEQDEGSIWEAAASAAHFSLSNLVAVIDKNGFQVDGPTREVMNMEPLQDKYRAFGWEVSEVDGNSMDEVVEALDGAVSAACEMPRLVIGNTVRGKGITFMENNPAFHYARLDEKELRAAGEELRGEWDAV
ncbi:MAG: transketolase [Candidatus Eremiobacteraeota bacterium]|nr:transketolase [Candidatus Eremiobacteraeota bacterium]